MLNRQACGSWGNLWLMVLSVFTHVEIGLCLPQGLIHGEFSWLAGLVVSFCRSDFGRRGFPPDESLTYGSLWPTFCGVLPGWGE